jgi:deoxyribodipyrimidine photolyase
MDDVRQIRMLRSPKETNPVMNQFEPPISPFRKYAIRFADGSETGSLTLDGAIRLIAHRYRARRSELITDTTEAKISVWLHPGEIPIAEVFLSSVMAETR